jgi:hypothetical protein
MQRETNYIMLAIVLAFGVFLVAGLRVVPAMTDEADAKNDKPKNPNHKRGHSHT